MNPVIDKIRKLLRLANDQGATTHEAAAAMAKAQQIATENGISLTDVPDDCGTTNGLTHIPHPSQAGLPHKLASRLIRNHFGLATLFDSTGRKAVIHIIGTPLQAQLATYVYIYLVRVLRQSWRCRENKRLRDREAFLRGFAHAISNKLPEVFPQDGLILSAEAYIAAKLIGPGAKLTHFTASKKPLSDSAWRNGYLAGVDTGIHNAIHGSGTNCLLQ